MQVVLVCELAMLSRMSLLVWIKKVLSATSVSVPGNHHSNRLLLESSKIGL